MRTILILLISFLTVFVCFAQDKKRENALVLSFGPSYIQRQDLIFSPNIHRDISFMNFSLDYTRKAKFFQKVSLRYGNFNPQVTNTYEFTFHHDPNTAYPHSFNMIDLDYQFGKSFIKTEKATITAGGVFLTDVQAMNYVYGRISSFGYFASFGLGAFGTYERLIDEKNKLAVTLKLPLFGWIARSPYLVNDDEFIENISSHSGFKTFMAYVADGQMATWNKLQTFDLELKYAYDLNKRWDFGAAYLFEFIHMSQPRNLLSFRNSLNVSATYKF